MGTEANEKIIEKIRKLMSLARNNSSEAEVESALRFARKLMQQYNLKEDAILLDEAPAVAVNRVIRMDAASWAAGALSFDRDTAWAAAKLCDCKWFLGIVYEKGKQRQSVTFYGMEHDVAVAVSMFNELRLTMRTMARFQMGQKWTSMHNDYSKGFAFRIRSRASDIAAERGGMDAKEQATTNAIILAKDAAIVLFGEKLHLQSGRSRYVAIKNSDAYFKGSEDANNVKLNTDGLEHNPTGQKLLK